MKEFKFKVGDIVKAVNNDKYGWTNKRNKWVGRVTRVDESSFCAKTLEMENGRWIGYVFTGLAYEYFEKDDRMLHPVIEKHLIKGNKTIIKLSNGKVGISKCNPEDKFDEAIGAAIATLRAYGKNVEDSAKEFTDCEHKEKPKTRKPFRVGQLVQIKDWGEMEREYGLDRRGDILCNPYFTKGMKPLCGEFAEITNILGASVRLRFFNFDGDTDWYYSTDMIKPIKKKEN
jgi:hypothetical protein